MQKLYDEGRTIGLSAYELYARQCIAEGVSPENVPTEKDWLSMIMLNGNSLILKIYPTSDEFPEDEKFFMDIPLPEDTILRANATIYAYSFLGTCFTNDNYDINHNQYGWATKVIDYGYVLQNIAAKHPTTSNVVDVNHYPDNLDNIDFDDYIAQTAEYGKIIDGGILQPGQWNVTPVESGREPCMDLSPNVSGQPVVRLIFEKPVTKPFYILLEGFRDRHIIDIGSDLSGSTNTKYPQNGDFLGPQSFPWTAKIIFTIPNAYAKYLEQLIEHDLSNYMVKGVDYVTAGQLPANLSHLGNKATAEGYNVNAQGDNSHAEGLNTSAIGQNSHAEGENTQASKLDSHAEGYATKANDLYSHAEGKETIASGTGSHSEGSNTSAVGNYSHSEGVNTSATNNYAHAEGHTTTAAGTASHTEGYNTSVDTTGYYAHAEGQGTKANGNSSHAEGKLSEALGNNSHAEGNTTKAIGSSSHSEGSSSQAEGDYSHVEGNSNVAHGTASHAEGNNTKAQGVYSHAEGVDSIAQTTASHAEGKSTASGEYSHSEGYITVASGNRSHSEGDNTTASGNFSHAEGGYTTASNEFAHSEGRNTIASNKYSHSEGNSTEASGIDAHAEGNSSKAQSEHSHAEGDHTTASGDSAHSEGYYTQSTASYCHSEGYYAKALGHSSHAEGSSTEASGYSSHAEGNVSKATASYSHAEGNGCNATAYYSHAEGDRTSIASGASAGHAEGTATSIVGSATSAHVEGEGTIAYQSAQHVAGKYNVQDTSRSYARVTGWGTSTSNRKNIETLDTNGNLTLAGSLLLPADGDISFNGLLARDLIRSLIVQTVSTQTNTSIAFEHGSRPLTLNLITKCIVEVQNQQMNIKTIIKKYVSGTQSGQSGTANVDLNNFELIAPIDMTNMIVYHNSNSCSDTQTQIISYNGLEMKYTYSYDINSSPISLFSVVANNRIQCPYNNPYNPQSNPPYGISEATAIVQTIVYQFMPIYES